MADVDVQTAKTRKPSAPARDLERENAAAHALKDQLKAILGEQGTDAATLRDMIEGETGLFETIDAVMAQIAEDAAHVAGIEKFQAMLAARKERLEKRAELMRTMLLNSLDILGEKRLRRALGTLSVRNVAPKLVVTNEADIPSCWWRPSDPVLDRKGLTDALKARAHAIEDLNAEHEAGQVAGDAYQQHREAIDLQHPSVPGAELGNGSVSLQIWFS